MDAATAAAADVSDGAVSVRSVIIYETATSLDGWIADTENSLSWLFAVPGEGADSEELAPPAAAVQVMGSTTYEWVAAELGAFDTPDAWQQAFGQTPVVVFSHRELPVPAGADVRIVTGNVARALPALREAAGDGDIWVVGGGDLAGQFADAGALEEIRVSIAPVTLGSGAPLFPRRLEFDRLRLVSVSQVGQFARLVYRLV